MASKRKPPGISPSLDAEKALPILIKQRNKGGELLERPHIDYVDYHGWLLTTREFLVRAFGSESSNIERLDDVDRPPSFYVGTLDDLTTPQPEPSTDHIKAYVRGKLVVLESCIDQLEALVPSRPSVARPNISPGNARVFLVHGRNEGVREAVARFVESLDLPVTILHEKPNQGRTIIDKFEAYADVGFAVILLTGDDKGGLAGDLPKSYRPRARQNVILELGFFLGRIGRERVCVLYEPGVEIPSDYSGVLFVELDPGKGWHFQLAREMRAAGLDVDMNKL